MFIGRKVRVSFSFQSVFPPMNFWTATLGMRTEIHVAPHV
jgi:hypothetical protein